MISYAQNLEDVLIARFFRGDQPQLYVDVGAAHPSYHSVTKHFCDAGWHGLNIEPRLQLWKMLQAERPRDWNLQCAVSETTGKMTFFDVTHPTYSGTDAGGLSTLDARQAALYRDKGYIVREKILEVYPLSQLLAEHSVQEIGFLKVDVEGFEYQVIRSLDWSKWRPRLVVTECTTPMTDIVCDDEVHSYLTQRGYIPALFDGLNRYFVREEDAQRATRLQVPANVTDNYILAEEVKLRRQLDECKAQVEQLVSKCMQAEATNLTLKHSIERLAAESLKGELAKSETEPQLTLRRKMSQLVNLVARRGKQERDLGITESSELPRKAA